MNTIKKNTWKDIYCAKAFVSTAFILIFLVITSLSFALIRILRNDLESLDYLRKIKLETIKERLIINTFTCNLSKGQIEDFNIADLYVEVFQTDDGYRLICEDIDLKLSLDDDIVDDYTHVAN